MLQTLFWLFECSKNPQCNSFVASTVEYVVIQQAQISYYVQYEFKIEILGQNSVYGEDLRQKFGKTITFTEALEDTPFSR